MKCTPGWSLPLSTGQEPAILLTLYPVTSDSFSRAFTCSQFRMILELDVFHMTFTGGWLGAGEKWQSVETVKYHAAFVFNHKSRDALVKAYEASWWSH